jgi:hypothetical protein
MSWLRAETPGYPQSSSEQARALRAARLLRFVQLSSERTLEPVREDSSFAEKQESHRALLVVVQLDSKRRFDRAAAERWFRREAAVLTGAPARRPEASVSWAWPRRSESPRKQQRGRA